MRKISFKLLKESLTRNEMRSIAGGGSTGLDVYEIRCGDGTLSRGLSNCPSWYHICDDRGGVVCCALEDTIC